MLSNEPPTNLMEINAFHPSSLECSWSPGSDEHHRLSPPTRLALRGAIPTEKLQTDRTPVYPILTVVRARMLWPHTIAASPDRPDLGNPAQ
jgi:hypothetical protein